MSEVYNQTVFDGELRKCVNHVHDWLHGKIKLALTSGTYSDLPVLSRIEAAGFLRLPL
jgi:hypothetical protein